MKKKEYRYLQIFSSVRINEQKQKNTDNTEKKEWFLGKQILFSFTSALSRN